MDKIIGKTKKILKKKGYTAAEIEYLLSLMQTTCVACKHADECKRVGIINEPYHPKCERHEFTDKIIFRS